MNALEQLVTCDGFINMVSTIAFWLVVYIVIRYLSYRSGLNDLLNRAKKHIASLRKICKNLSNMCKGSELDVQNAITTYKWIAKLQKLIFKLLVTYLFDDRNDKDVLGAKTLVEPITDMCKAALSRVVEVGNDADVQAIFEEIDSNLSTASDLLSNAQKKDQKQKLLKV